MKLDQRHRGSGCHSTRAGMWLRVYLVAVAFGCSLAEGDGTPRRTAHVPFVADAVGNALPPPSEVPSKVGSPSNLLTPDRYEFYTFDESGELIKRLMTLEEIQAIVAAGDGNDGHMVTFAQDEKPTIAFNFSQPPFTKVHSVVTNVQNVLKSQMEAQKNNPPNPTTFDTPDVSNSWSMILPSIFGNTGVEIVPDKLSSSFGTPETDTIDFGTKPIHSTDIVTSKEDPDADNIENSKNNPPLEFKEEQNNEPLTSKSTSTTKNEKTTTTTTTPKPTTIITMTTTSKPTTTTTTTTTPKPTTTTTTSTTPKPTTTITTTTTPNPTTTTTKKPTTTKIILNQPSQLSPENNSYEKISTAEPIHKFVQRKPETASKKPGNSNNNSHILASTTTETSYVEITRLGPTTAKPLTAYGVTTSITNGFSPTKRVPDSVKIMTTTVPPLVSVTTYRPSSNIFSSTTEIPKVSFTLSEFDGTKNGNGTTLTTQSVSPSTAHTTTDVISSHNNSTSEEDVTKQENPSDKFQHEMVPSFDVAQSISQIASDLEKGFVIQNNDGGLEAEVKDNIDLDLPDATTTPKSPNDKLNSTFIKISTSDPQGLQTVHDSSSSLSPQETHTTVLAKPIASPTTEGIKSVHTPTKISVNSAEANTQVDEILTESMSDLLSQVVNQLPNNIAQTTISNNMNTITESTLNYSTNTDPVTKSNLSIENHTTNADNANAKKNIPAVVNSISNSINEQYISKNDTITEIQDSIELFTPSPTTLSTQQSPKEEHYKESAEIRKESSQSDKTSSTEIIVPVNTEIPNTTKISVSTKVLPIPILNNRIGPGNETNLFDQMFSNDQNKTTKEPNIQLLQDQIANVTGDKVPIENKLTENQSTETSQKQQQKVNDAKKKIQKVNIDDKEYTDSTKNDSWKLVPTVPPPRGNEISILNDESNSDGANIPHIPEFANGFNKEINLNGSKENQGLQVTIKHLGEDVYQFIDLCNELAFRYWNSAVENIDKRRSFILSPYSITSMLAMMFMGARGATSGEMNDILKLDDMVTFNPHFTLKNISDSIEANPESGVAVSVFVRELYSDRNQGKLLTFYKERAQHFYNGHVEEINFKLINDIIRRRTNLLVKRHTWGKINEYIKNNDITMKPPLAAFSANILETDCTGSSVEGRDGEMYFVVSPSVRQRRLVPVPAVVYRAGFLAGYDPVLDATAAAVGTASSVVSTVLLMPGQQGNTVHADDLEKLEKKLLNSIPTATEWYRLLRTLLPRPGLELQIPRFSHRSVFNVSAALRGMGLHDIFDPSKADLGGLNGPSKDLYLSDMIETSTFVTCGEGPVGEQHHIEEYPELRDASRKRRNSRFWDEPRDYQRSFHDPHDLGAALLPLHLRPRQARLPSRAAPPQPARLKFDRPFLYFVRHNPSGIILYVGRYNPRLLP